MGWNDLSSKQQADWKKKNFNMKVRVSEAQLNKLRAQGTPTKAIGKYKNDASMRESLNRFYGKARVDKAIGNIPKPPKPPKPPVTKPKVPPTKSKPPKTIPNRPVPNPKPGPKPTPPPKGQKIDSSGFGGQIGLALDILSWIPMTAMAGRALKVALVAKRAQTSMKGAKAIIATTKAVKKGKPLAIAATRGAQRVKPYPKSLTKRVVNGAKNPKAYVTSTGKRVGVKPVSAGKTILGKRVAPKPLGKRVTSKSTRPVGKRSTTRSTSSSTRSVRSTGRRGKK